MKKVLPFFRNGFETAVYWNYLIRIKIKDSKYTNPHRAYGIFFSGVWFGVMIFDRDQKATDRK